MGAEADELAGHLRSALVDLVPDPGPLVVAVSGGADSCALLDLLVAGAAAGRALSVYHLDHALRPESAAEAAWVERCVEEYRAAGHALAATVERVPVRVQPRRGLEASARGVRYRRLAAHAASIGAAAVVTAHHRDDQAETVLQQLLRGCGPAGAPGMPAIRPLGATRLVRPLLARSGHELRAYLRARGREWCEDPSNRDQRFTRNRIRHHLLPSWEAAVPGLAAELAAHAARTRQRLATWDATCAQACIWGEDQVRVAPALVADRQLAAHLARRLLERLDARRDRAAVARVVDLLAGRSGRRFELGCWVVARWGAGLRWWRRDPVAGRLAASA